MRAYHPGQKANRASEWRFYLVAQALFAGLLLWASGAQAVCVGATPCVNNAPLYIVSAAPPNVLMILSNAQNMDEAPDGQAAGANSPDSKSWQARDVIKTLVGNYSGQISLGLMSFKLNGTSNYGLYQSPYDASYNPANWNPSYSGNRDSSTKRFCEPNPSHPGTCTPAGNKLSGSCTGGDCIFYNINLPFYGSNTGSDQLYCLSQSANFDNGSETYPGGPWDSYRCYQTKTGSADFTANSWPGTASNPGLGYSNLLATYTFSPTDSDLAQNVLDFGKQLASTYAAPAWYVNNSPGPGYLNVPIAPLNSTQASAINTKLVCNLPGYPSPLPTGFTKAGNLQTCTATGLQNAGLTPIEGSITTAKNYFTGNLTAAEGKTTGAGGTYSSPNYSVNGTSCGKNYAILLTNGLPNVDKNGSVITTNGQPDPTKALQQASSAAQSLHNSNVDLYVVGFAMPFGTNPANLDTIASNGGTGQSYYASNSAALQTTLNSVFTSILQSSGSSSALASNSTSVGTNTFVYQASFDATDWTGKLDAYQITTNTSGGQTTSSVSSTAQWQASKLIPAAASRNILTWDGTQGQSFLWANLSGNEQCYLAGQSTGCTLSVAQTTTGQDVLNYLRGDSSLELKNGVGSYRNRSTALGDIVDSNPLYLSNEDYGYTVLTGSEGSTYSTYVQGKTVNKIYVGANDGMLHAFDAASGVESWAYVPGAVFPHLADLTSSSYNSNHEYFVDGSPASGDAFYSGAWHTILLGTLGATSGTKAAFALDITNPASMNNSKVLWEFTDANDLGQTWGRGSVARFNDGNYYAVINNGYNSVNKHAVLFLVQVNNPSNVVKLDTGVGGNNGLSQPVLLDADHNGTIDAIYAGDLQGDVWKFDVSSATKASWQVGYSGLPLFKARDAGGAVQPITAPLALGSMPPGATGTVMVFFGTGQYLNTSDISNTATQSLYGVLDTSVLSGGAFSGGTGNFTRTTQVSGSNVLVQQSIDTQTSATRGVTSNAVSYPGKLGWYMDLITPPNSKLGERVISEPLIRSGRVVFVTLIPGTNPCVPGGESWVMELDAATGGSPTSAFLDYNNDGTYDTVTLSNGSTAAAVGVHLTTGFGHTPVSMTSGNSSTTVTNDSSGALNSWNVLNNTGTPRASWSQIK